MAPVSSNGRSLDQGHATGLGELAGLETIEVEAGGYRVASIVAAAPLGGVGTGGQMLVGEEGADEATGEIVDVKADGLVTGQIEEDGGGWVEGVGGVHEEGGR